MINLFPLQFQQATYTTQTHSTPKLVGQCLHYILANDFLQCAQFKMQASCQDRSFVYLICFLGSYLTIVGGGSSASGIFCAAYHPKSEGWGGEDKRGVSSFISQEVSLTTAIRQTPEERGQPGEGCLSRQATAPLKEPPFGLKDIKCHQGEERLWQIHLTIICEKSLPLIPTLNYINSGTQAGHSALPYSRTVLSLSIRTE